MRMMFRKVLILDNDPETLITLQGILEPCGGRCYGHLERSSSMPLAQPRVFRPHRIGDLPPKIDQAAILRDFRFQSTTVQAFILRGIAQENMSSIFVGSVPLE